LAWFGPQNLEIIWPRNNWCEAGFEDVFNKSLCKHRPSSFEDVQGTVSKGEVLLFGHENQFGCPFDNFIDIRRLVRPKTEIFRATASGGRQAMIFTAEIHPSLSLNDILSVCRLLDWNPAVKSEAESFARTHGLQQGLYHGLHIRLTDSGYQPDQYRKYFAAPSLTKEKVLICTDDHEEALRLVGGRTRFLMRRPNDEPEKYQHGRDWRVKTEYRDGRSFGFNVRRSREAILDGVTDLILLAGSKIIPTKLSSFSEVAGYLGYSHQPVIMKLYLFRRRWVEKIKFAILWWRHFLS